MNKFKIAKDVDVEYYNKHLIAKKAGVKFLAYRCDISSKKIFNPYKNLRLRFNF
jgi:sugar fermentation stimulation protein A